MCTMRNAKDSRDLHQRGRSKKPEQRFHLIKADKSVKSVPKKVAGPDRARKSDTVHLVMPRSPTSHISSVDANDRKSGNNGAGVTKPTNKDKLVMSTPERKRPKWAEQLLRGADTSSPLPRKARMALLTDEAAMSSPPESQTERVPQKLSINGAAAAGADVTPVLPLLKKRQLKNGSGAHGSSMPTIVVTSPTSTPTATNKSPLSYRKSPLPERKSPLLERKSPLRDAQKSPLRDRHGPSSHSVSDGCADALDAKVRTAFGFGARDALKVVRTEDGSSKVCRRAQSHSALSLALTAVPIVLANRCRQLMHSWTQPHSEPASTAQPRTRSDFRAVRRCDSAE